ncbi:MAG: hypothetical protein KAH23_10500, partial [Kiritimatiellae bacterium]|nr:hypothetical protein [Kiritimatiellia bacterium]
MLKRSLLLWLGLVLFTGVGHAVEAKAEKKLNKNAYVADWQTIYGGKEDDIAYGIVALENGDSAIVGTCKSFGAKRTDICVTRMTPKGEMIWRLWLGGKKKDEGKAISRAADGSILVLGHSKSFTQNYDYNLHVAKISLDGKLVWEKSVGGKLDEFAGGIAGTDDGGALVVGSSQSFGEGDKNVYIVKLD